MIIAFLGGILLGIFFFGGLYFTVERIQQVKHPVLFMVLSLLIRLAILLLGFYLLMDSRYQNLLAALAGVLLSRFFLIRKFGHTKKMPLKKDGEFHDY